MSVTAFAGAPVTAHRLVRLARECLAADLGFLASIGDVQEILAIDGDAVGFGIAPGTTLRMPDSMCERMLTGRIPHVVRDTRTHPVAREATAAIDAGVGSYAGVPVCSPDGAPVATLCVIGHEPDPELRGADARFLASLAAPLGVAFSAGETFAEDLGPELDLSDASSETIGRVRLSLEVGSRLGLDDAALIDVAAQAAAFTGAERRIGAARPELPIAERIVFTAGAYVAMTTERPGHPAITASGARNALRRGAATRFCPLAVAALLAVVNLEAAPRGRWIAREHDAA